ncbi:MAG: phosphatase PAP2 family protein [Clostridiales bacterium]|nr:phosphatase PAP2 family protein [Clostridiales bacterium]
MKEDRKMVLLIGLLLLAAFALWTFLVLNVDVQNVGPEGTKVGFSTFNVWFHQVTGAHMILYTITDWLGIVPIVICMCFGVLGFVQLVERRSFFKVDTDILLLGAYFILVVMCYLLFEMVHINYRPILIDGRLEASYPSSTTLLVLSVMPTMKIQICRRINNRVIKNVTTWFVVMFSLFMVIGRLVSGVHWATDIIGSVFLSFGLYALYRFFVM